MATVVSDMVVLLPVHNSEETLPAALDSLRNQTFRSFRVIAVEDGSTDRTGEILDQAASDWAKGGGPGPLLTVLRHSRRMGIARSLQDAAEEAGDAAFLARQDADDVSLPERLESQLAFLRDRPEIGLVATGIETVSRELPSDGWKRYEAWLDSCRTPEEIALNLWIESPLPHPTILMRRSAYDAAGGYRDMGWPEDYDLWLRMLRAGVRMAKLPERLVRWSDHPGRASRTLPEYAPDRFLACRIHHLVRFLEDRPVVVWGAGRDGRRAGRALLAEGQAVEAFLDIDPRKIGRTAHGRPIVSAESWLNGMKARSGRPMVLAAVGTSGARDLIKARLAEAGFEEGPDFLCLA